MELRHEVYERNGAQKGDNPKRLGARLSDLYGEDQVKTVRFVNGPSRFDGIFFDGYYYQLKQQLPRAVSPKDITTDGEEVVIIPDEGPIKGDERFTAADYIITII